MTIVEESDGVDILDPNQESALGGEVEANSETVDLVNLVLAALRTKLDNTQRHFFMGEAFRGYSDMQKLEVVDKLVDQRISEAVEGEEEEPLPEEEEEPVEELPEEEPLPEEEEPPLEIPDLADTAVRALLADPDALKHTLPNIPYEVTEENHKEIYEIVKSRLYY